MPSPSYQAILDTTILGWMEDALLEPNNGGQNLATTQFSLQQLIDALNQASMEFQRDTGAVACHVGFWGDSLDGIPVTPNEEPVPLPQDMMDVRRRAWISFK